MSSTIDRYRRNITRVLHSATQQEIVEGLTFYEGAHGICRLLCAVGAKSVEHAAGIYAALSPMNTWDLNVANCFDVLRGDVSRVNTTESNRLKAARIADGEHPEEVLKYGRKVLSFYLCIAHPTYRYIVPVDRHLIRVAIGDHVGNASLSKIAKAEYSRIEKVYLDVGLEEGELGNRAASIVWFVKRRMDESTMNTIS